jgi:hypothetical protein
MSAWGDNYNYNNITAAATTVCKAGSGVLHSVTLTNVAASSTVTVFDNTAGSGTKIFTYTAPAAASTTPVSMILDVLFRTGLTVVTTNTNDITVSFK